MKATEIAIEILRKIHAGIAASNERLAAVEDGISGLRRDVNAGFAEEGQRLAALERHAAATNETLGLIHHRLQFAEAASGAATSARSRRDDRMDRLEARVDALEARDESSER